MIQKLSVGSQTSLADLWLSELVNQLEPKESLARLQIPPEQAMEALRLPDEDWNELTDHEVKKILGTRMLTMARAAGCPDEQAENFCAAEYYAQEKQFLFHAAARECDKPDGPTEVAFGGSRGPGKSHALLGQITVDDCQRHPNLRCLLLRRVGKAVRESFEALRLRVLGKIPHKYNRSTGTLNFPNGSVVILGHYRNDNDIDNYLGLEYDVIGVEEATTLSGEKYRAIRTCSRTSKEDWEPRTYSNANPGGVGHEWYKDRFLKPYRLNQQTTTRFIPATYRDNAFLNDGYVDILNGLVGWQKLAWRDGDWDVAAGQYFTNFHREIHVVEAYPIPEWYPEVWLAGDYGWTHPTCVLLFAKDLKGNIFVVDEYLASKRLPAAHSVMWRQMLERREIREERLSQFPFGQDAWAKNQEGRSVFDSYSDEGWKLEQANMNRLSGAEEVLRRLGDAEADVPASLFIFEHCTRLIETITRMQHNPHRPEDVLKVDVDEQGVGGDDAYDTLRYGLMAVAKAPLEFATTQLPEGWR